MKCRSVERLTSLVRLTVIFVMLLLAVPKAMLAQSAANDDRIQLGGLDGKPLLPIVEIMGNGSRAGQGTGIGFLLKNCTVMTNMHVLEPGIIGEPDDKTYPLTFNGKILDTKSFVGKEYSYRTQKLGPDKKRLSSTIRILAHGDYNQTDVADRYANDWAIGEDLGCLSVTAKLGFYTLLRASYNLLKGQDIYSAGFSIKPGTPMNGEILVVDSKCQIEFNPQNDLWQTTCFLDQKGSGSVAGRKVPPEISENGLLAVGIFMSSNSPSYMIPLYKLFTENDEFKRIIETERSPKKSPQ